MSGFEFLAIVRKRFPHIATMAVSGEYITSKNPSILADAFLQKGVFRLDCWADEDNVAARESEDCKTTDDTSYAAVNS
jgi:hypothetical protein